MPARPPVWSTSPSRSAEPSGWPSLVTVFATAGPGAASGPSASVHAKELFVLGADRGFGVAAALIGVAVVLVLAFARPRRAPVVAPVETLALEPATT